MHFLVAEIPITIPENAGEIVETVKANPQLLAILIGIGVLTAALFVWGIMKHAIKAVIFGGVLSVGAWFWYFNIR
ncbi:MAG TPA: hypothetical protein DCY40_09155 [Actinobacteria bacterium]|nr:hypothetical protein [Actinomycetota bacterium]